MSDMRDARCKTESCIILIQQALRSDSNTKSLPEAYIAPIGP